MVSAGSVLVAFTLIAFSYLTVLAFRSKETFVEYVKPEHLSIVVINDVDALLLLTLNISLLF